MKEQIEKELEVIKESILQTVPAEAIYLFGSHAYGTPTENSDLDIYVVVPDDVENLIDKNGDIRLKLWGRKKYSLDLKMGYSGKFHHRRNLPTLERVVAQKGKVIYRV